MLDISLTIKSLDTRLWAAGNSMADTSLGWLMFLLCGSSVCVCIECESHCIPTPTCADQDDEWHKDNDGSKDRHDTGGTAPGGGPYPDMTFNEDCIGNQSQRSKPSCNSHLHHTSRENERWERMIKMSVNASDMMLSLFQRGCQCQISHDCHFSSGLCHVRVCKMGKLWAWKFNLFRSAGVVGLGQHWPGGA